VSKPRVAIQLIIFGERAQTDLPGVLADVAAAGYDGFESGAPVGGEEADRLRSAMQDTALGYVGGHCGEDQWMDPGTVAAVARSVADLGGGFVFASGGFSWRTIEEYRNGAAALTEAGRRCRDAGVKLCYHNHAWEFGELDGQRPIHFLMEQTDTALVKLCPDVYWVHVGGEDPAQFIVRYGKRSPCFHFKDGLGGERFREFRELGRGCVDLESALAAALACAPQWIITEQDTTEGDPAESARISRNYLSSVGL
jgi:sugar phosphate isomerase/epimerase